MKKFLLATVALAAFATGANALTLTSASVMGVTDATGAATTGTVWTTDTAPGGYYGLFLQAPQIGDFLNPNLGPINIAVPFTYNPSRLLLAGEGYYPTNTQDSDPFYQLTLGFDGGQTLKAIYNPQTNTFISSTSFMDGNNTYSVSEFSYRRFLGDTVQPYTATPGGDGNDYVGNVRLMSVSGTVPEPASWALMVGGFGLIGAAARRRSRMQATVA